MDETDLPQVCDIMLEVEVSDQYNPAKNVLSVLIPSLPCRLDSLFTRFGHEEIATNQTNSTGRAGGLLFLAGSLGAGGSRLFDERNLVRLEGYVYNISVIHDIWGGADLDHYELEINKGIVR